MKGQTSHAQNLIPAQRFQMRFGQREHGERFADGVKNFDRIARFDVRNRSGVMLNDGGHGVPTDTHRATIARLTQRTKRTNSET